jgi:hypothetical protein
MMDFFGNAVNWRSIETSRQLPDGRTITSTADVLFVNDQPADFKLRKLVLDVGGAVLRTIEFDKEMRIVKDSTIRPDWLEPPALESIIEADRRARKIWETAL